EPVVDADVPETVAEAGEDARRGAPGEGRAGDHDGAHDEADGGAPEAALEAARLLGLVDLDLALAGLVGDRGIHDLDGLVGIVDLLDDLEERLGGLAVLEDEDRQRLYRLLCAHRSLAPPGWIWREGAHHGVRPVHRPRIRYASTS